MTKLEQAARQALEALEEYTEVVTSSYDSNSWVKVADGGKPAREAITALREALAEPAKHHCGDECQHASDCAVHRSPAYPEGPCNCEVSQAKHQEELNKFAEDSVWDGEGP